MQNNIAYHISPSVLDTYGRYLSADADWDDIYGFADASPVSKTDFIQGRLDNLINMVNGIQSTPNEAASLGTCFNEAIDCIILNTKSTRKDVSLMSCEISHPQSMKVITAVQGNFKFMFPKDKTLEIASILKNSSCIVQDYVEADIDTCYGKAQLYGYPDYYNKDGFVIDLKTTSNYSCRKYENYSQRYIYPYCLHKSGKIDDYIQFTFLVAECKTSKSNHVTNFEVMRENYTDGIQECENTAKMLTENFIAWYRDAINSKVCTDRLCGKHLEQKH